MDGRAASLGPGRGHADAPNRCRPGPASRCWPCARRSPRASARETRNPDSYERSLGRTTRTPRSGHTGLHGTRSVRTALRGGRRRPVATGRGPAPRPRAPRGRACVCQGTSGQVHPGTPQAGPPRGSGRRAGRSGMWRPRAPAKWRSPFGHGHRRGAGPGSCALAAPGRVAERVAFHHHDVGAVEQPVHRRRRHELVLEERVPLLDRAVRGQHRRAPLVARPDPRCLTTPRAADVHRARTLLVGSARRKTRDSVSKPLSQIHGPKWPSKSLGRHRRTT